MWEISIAGQSDVSPAWNATSAKSTFGGVKSAGSGIEGRSRFPAPAMPWPTSDPGIVDSATPRKHSD